MQDGVSLTVLHCSLKCVALALLFSNLGDKCVTLALFFSFDASVVAHTCKRVYQKWHASFLEIVKVTFAFNKQVEIHTSHFSVAAH